jgi:hypothetical protein
MAFWIFLGLAAGDRRSDFTTRERSGLKNAEILQNWLNISPSPSFTHENQPRI